MMPWFTGDVGQDSVPVAPGRLPLVGHAIPFLFRPVSFLRGLREHGDMVRIGLGPLPVYVLNAPGLIHEVLVEQGRTFRRGKFFDRVGAIAGQDVQSQTPDSQLRQRRMTQPAFHRDRLPGYAAILNETAAATARSWRPGQTVDIHGEMFNLVMESFARTLFGSRQAEHAVTELQRSMPVILQQLARRALSPFAFLDTLPTPANRRFDAAHARLRAAVNELIVCYRQDRTDHGDLLSVLLTARDDRTGETMSDAQIHSTIIFLMIAGVHTTALTLSAVFLELSRHPEIEHRLHAELDHVLTSQHVAFQDLPRLSYTRRVIHEALRLHTPVHILMRRTITSTRLGGVTLPPGTEVLYSPYTLHRDGGLYRDPLRFDPDRWIGDAGSLPNGAFIPFSIGKNRCLGEAFAWTEMIIAVAAITSQWRLQPANMIRGTPSATLRPRRLLMIPSERRPSNR